MKQAHIFQVNMSNGGLPKLPVHDAQVTLLGLEGDRQNDRQHHGGPDRALCLFALERILALQEKGHPIFAGSTGENLTLAGVDWAQLRPGTRLRLGDTVVIEITQYTTPCQKIASSFCNGQIQRMSQEHYPGWARLYARILSPGEIRIGDPVVLSGAKDNATAK